MAQGLLQRGGEGREAVLLLEVKKAVRDGVLSTESRHLRDGDSDNSAKTALEGRVQKRRPSEASCGHGS